MKLRFQKASRKFGNQNIFMDLNLEIENGSRWAILGANGSGKSTFLKCAYGALSLTEGRIEYQAKDGSLSPTEAAHRMGYSAPYFELIEELSAVEFLNTLQKFRPFQKDWESQQILEACLLEHAAKKRIADFSSGMKQRLRLGVAVLSEVDLVILDEPSSNLDKEGLAWYQRFLEAHLNNRTLLVGTNYSEDEAFLCDQKLLITDYS